MTLQQAGSELVSGAPVVTKGHVGDQEDLSGQSLQTTSVSKDHAMPRAILIWVAAATTWSYGDLRAQASV